MKRLIQSLRPRRLTLRQTLGRAIFMAVMHTILLGSSAYIATHLAATPMTFEQPGPQQVVPATPSPAEVLIKRHHCWTGEAPADMQGKFPGHVVVSLPDGRGPRLAGPVMVGKALDTIFGEAKHAMTIYAFCR